MNSHLDSNNLRNMTNKKPVSMNEKGTSSLRYSNFLFFLLFFLQDVCTVW